MLSTYLRSCSIISKGARCVSKSGALRKSIREVRLIWGDAASYPKGAGGISALAWTPSSQQSTFLVGFSCEKSHCQPLHEDVPEPEAET